MTTIDPFAPGESVGYFKFDNVGDTAVGLVDKVEEVQSRDFDTGEPEFWPDGRPKMIFRIELRNIDTGEVTNLWARKQMISAIREAAKEAGGIVGRLLTVKHHEVGEPKKRGYKPPKLYKAKVEPAPAKVAPRVEPRPAVDDPFGDVDDSF